MTYLCAGLVTLGVTSPLLVVGVWFWVAMAVLTMLGFVVGTVIGRDDRP